MIALRCRPFSTRILAALKRYLFIFITISSLAHFAEYLSLTLMFRTFILMIIELDTFSFEAQIVYLLYR